MLDMLVSFPDCTKPCTGTSVRMYSDILELDSQEVLDNIAGW